MACIQYNNRPPRSAMGSAVRLNPQQQKARFLLCCARTMAAPTRDIRYEGIRPVSTCRC
jgi:hypothetical protein